MTGDDHIQAVFDKFFDDAAGAEEREALVGLLRADPALQRRFLQESVIRADMREWATEQLARAEYDRVDVPNMEAPAPAGRPMGLVRTRQVRPRQAAFPPARVRPAAPWGWRITALAAAVLVGIGVLFSRQWRPLRESAGHVFDGPVATLDAVRGAVWRLDDGIRVPLREGDRLLAGQRVLTGEGASFARVLLRDSTKLELAPHTDLAFPQDTRAHGNALLVEAGLVDADVPALRSEHPLTVTTRHIVLVVLGTRFTVKVTPESTRVEVRRGRVRLTHRHNGEETVLEEGWHALVDTRTAVAVTPRFEEKAPPAFEEEGRGPTALYTFREGAGAVVHDVSGVGEPLDLCIENPPAVAWLPAGGLRVRTPVRIFSTGTAAKIVRACRASQALTVEAWITPADAEQGAPSNDRPARIVTISPDSSLRDFTLGQHGPTYMWRVFTTRPQPPDNYLVLETGPGSAAGRLTHLVGTCEPGGRMRLFVDGAIMAEGPASGDFSNWDESFPLVLARENQPDGDSRVRAWLGTLHGVAVYDRALAPEEVARRLRAGPRFPASAHSRL